MQDSTHRSAQPSSLSRFREQLITYLVGAMRGPLGNLSRRYLYRFIFKHFGSDVRIQAGSEFRGAHSIVVGNYVIVSGNVRLNADFPGCSIVLGDHVNLDRGVDIWVSNQGECHIEIGDSAYIGRYVCMTGPGPIKIGRHCMIASHSSLYSNQHVFDDPTRPIATQGLTHKGIVIEDDCWIGTGVRVLDGVTIGQGSVIGAGAVVTKNIPPYSIAVGVPAKVISKRGDRHPSKVLIQSQA